MNPQIELTPKQARLLRMALLTHTAKTLYPMLYPPHYSALNEALRALRHALWNIEQRQEVDA